MTGCEQAFMSLPTGSCDVLDLTFLSNWLISVSFFCLRSFVNTIWQQVGLQGYLYKLVLLFNIHTVWDSYSWAEFVIPERAGAYFSYYHYPTGCVYSFCIIGMRYGYLRQRQSTKLIHAVCCSLCQGVDAHDWIQCNESSAKVTMAHLFTRGWN